MFRRKLIVLIVLSVVALDLLLGFYFRGGKIMAQSQDLKVSWKPTIKVREIRRFPIWGFFLGILNDNPQYRFEYYQYDSPIMWSAQSYVGESYVANSAKVAWSEDGTATVSLDEMPLFSCKRGAWSAITSH